MGYQWISQTCHKVHWTENYRHDISAIVCPLSDFPPTFGHFHPFIRNESIIHDPKMMYVAVHSLAIYLSYTLFFNIPFYFLYKSTILLRTSFNQLVFLALLICFLLFGSFVSFLDTYTCWASLPASSLFHSIHKLRIETGRYDNLPRDERLCNLCNCNRIEDETHFLLDCSSFSSIRDMFFSKTRT